MLCPCLYRTEHFSRERERRKGAEQRKEGGWPARGRKEKRTPANRSGMLAIFETPVTVTPQTGNFKNFKFFKTSQKIKNVYFWGKNVYFWGKNVSFWGSSGFSGFLDFLFFLRCWGVLGLRGSGGPRRAVGVFEAIPRSAMASLKICTAMPVIHPNLQ